jgi:hypothetical protein
VEFWCKKQVIPASTLDRYIDFVRRQLFELPREEASKQIIAALGDFEEGFSIIAKIWEQVLETWLSPTQGFRDEMGPLPREAIPKD